MNEQPQPSNQSQSPLGRLYELLEVLRPDFEGQDEVAPSEVGARAELAELLEKYPHLIDVWHEIARVDDLLGEAITDVAVPEGLKDRLIEAVHDPKRMSADKVLAGKSSGERRFAKTRVVATVLAASLLLMASIAWWFASSSPRAWNENQVLTIAAGHFAKETSVSAKDLSASLSESERTLLQQYVPSEDVLQPSVATWEKVDDFLGRSAVVYRFDDRQGNQAALFVIRQDQPVTGLVDRPPHRPQLMTAGRVAGAWQSDGLLYVLVSSGGENGWRSLLVPDRPMT